MQTVKNPINTAFSGSIPTKYDAHLGPLFFEPYALELARRIEALAPTSVLELACGTGRLTRHLDRVLDPSARLVATDVNPAMLDFARTAMDMRGVEWAVVDAVELPYPDANFDVVVAQFGVMFYSDRDKAYREALRVLKPGGSLVFTCWDSMAKNPVARLTQDVVEQFFPENTPAFYQVPFAYHDRLLIREEVLLAGYSRVELSLTPLEGTASSAEDAARGLLEGSPIHTAILERDPFALPVMRERLQQRLAASFGERDLRVPLSAWVVTATVS